jgi:hypothetical protein
MACRRSLRGPQEDSRLQWLAEPELGWSIGVTFDQNRVGGALSSTASSRSTPAAGAQPGERLETNRPSGS